MTVESDILPPRYLGPTPIGRGAMGEIYRATDESLGRAVAIKVLAERYAQDESVRERFTREALAAARLSGRPNVVTIFDVGEWQGRPYIVMEHLGGGSLGDRLGAGEPIAPRQAIAWVDQAAVALDAAHAEGIVHRDVKPGNLLLDREGNVHVADFGVASATGLDSLTKTGTVVGTAGYLAPEQAQGERASPASDRYGLAVVAFELLTGERPYQGDTAAAEAAAHVYAPIPTVSERRPELPLELDAVFARALAKRPEDRYPSAAELVADIRRALAEAAGTTRVLAAPPPRPAWLVPALAALALLGAGIVAAAIVTAGDEDEQGARPTTIVRTVTTGGTTEVRVTVTEAEPTEPTRGGGLSLAQARALQDESTAAMERGDWKEALRLAQRALRRLEGTGDRYEAFANYNVGRSLIELGDCEQGLPYIDRSEALQGHRSEFDEARASCA